jgi:Fe-coproporphyrin III synthase
VIQVHPTLLCNLRCRHCYSSSGPELRGALNAADLLPFLAWARGQGYETVSFSGGEPLAYPDLVPLARSLKGFGYRLALTTNGLLLDEPRLEALAGLLDLMALSVDGPPELHDEIRARRGAFERTAAALARVRAAGQAFGLIHTVTRQSLPHLPWLADFALEQGAGLLQLHPLAGVGRGHGMAASHGLDQEHCSRLYLLARLIGARLEPEVRVQLDLAPRDAVLARRTSYRLLGWVASAGAAGTAALSDLVNPLIVRADGRVTGFDYGLAETHPIARLGAGWESDVERFFRTGAATLGAHLAERFAALERRPERFVDWYAHLAVAPAQPEPAAA